MEHRRGEVYVTVHVLMCFIYVYIYIFPVFFLNVYSYLFIFIYADMTTSKMSMTAELCETDGSCWYVLLCGFQTISFFGNSRKLLETLKEFDLLIPPISDARARLPKCKMQG